MTLPTDDKKGPSANRIILWVVIAVVGLYFVISGVVGILT